MSRSTMQIRNDVAEQLDDLLLRHRAARATGSGWTGLPQDIAALSTALAELERAMAEKRRTA